MCAIVGVGEGCRCRVCADEDWMCPVLEIAARFQSLRVLYFFLINEVRTIVPTVTTAPTIAIPMYPSKEKTKTRRSRLSVLHEKVDTTSFWSIVGTLTSGNTVLNLLTKSFGLAIMGLKLKQRVIELASVIVVAKLEMSKG